MPNETRLRYLFEASRLGTMRAASELLDVAPSSISRQIALLETELGIALIERGRRGVLLTEAGRSAVDYFRDARAQEEAFRSRIEELRSIRAGKVTLAVGEAIITEAFSEQLQGFMQAHPGLFVDVRMSGTSAVAALVREDEAHFGLIFDLPREPKLRARLRLDQPLAVMAHPRHELTRRRRVGLADVQRHSIALPEDSFRIRQVVHAAEQEEGKFLEPGLVTNSMLLLKDFAKSGKGITILPPILGQPELARGELAAITTTNAILNGTQMSLITRAGRRLPGGAHRLMMLFERYLKHVVAQPH